MYASEEDPNDGFPWDKVEAAKRYLYLVKPWWSRYGEVYSIVPVLARTFGTERFGATTSTDLSGRIYIDRQFALSAPVHLIAGSIEHEILHHIKDTWNRMSYLSEEEWGEYANIAMDLEINSILHQENERIDFERIRQASRSSSLFSATDMQRWNVTEPPSLGEDCWLPSRVGLPDRLSAERYVTLLRDSDNMAEDEEDDDGNSDIDGSDQDSEDQESSGETNQEESEDSAGSDDQQSEKDDQPESEESDDDTESDQNADDNSDSDQESDDDQQSEAETGDADSESDAEPSDSDEPSDAPESSESDDESESESDSADDANDAESDAQSAQDDGESPAESATAQDEGQPSKETAEKVAELSASGMTKLQANSLSNPDDDFDQPNWMPDEEDMDREPSSFERDQAEKMLLEDVEKERKDGNSMFGTGEGGAEYLEEWSDDYKQARGMNWEAHFLRLLNAHHSSAKITGQSDLSMSVRNPHQQPLGVILPGLHDYTPTIYTLQDVSGSMRGENRMSRAMTAFTDLTTKAFSRFGSRNTWIAADTKIEAVGSASSWQEISRTKFKWSFGGTDLGQLIGEIMSKGFTHEKKRYQKPDLLIVSTDCMFKWPEKRPKNGCRILVLDLNPEKSHLLLPDWLNRKTEYVAVD